MNTDQYHITKSFNKESGKIQHVITHNGKTIYSMEYKFTSTGDRPSSPIDYLEAALRGEQIIIIPQYHQELQNIAFKLHLLNVCKTDEKTRISFRNQLKVIFSKLFDFKMFAAQIRL